MTSDHPPHGDADRVFVLRFWLERSDDSGRRALWRAKVTEPDAGLTRHANSVDEALAMVRDEMSRTSKDGAAPPQ
jgi:hypothetical protein